MAFTQLVAISKVWIWAWNLVRSSFSRDGASFGGLVLWLGAVCMACTQLVATGSVWIWARNLLRGFFARDGACLDGLGVLEAQATHGHVAPMGFDHRQSQPVCAGCAVQATDGQAQRDAWSTPAAAGGA